MKKIIEILNRNSKQFYAFVIILGAANSLFHSGILVVINKVISRSELPFFPGYTWAVFVLLVVLTFGVSKLFQSYIIRLTRNMLFEFEVMLIDKLRYAFYQDFEKIGEERVYTAINDTKVLAGLPEVFINVLNAMIIVSCGLLYMFWVSPVGGACVMLLMAGLFVLYQTRDVNIVRDLNRVRTLDDDYYRYLKDLLFGFKEIKMSITKNDNIFYEFLRKNRHNERQLGIKAAIRYLDNELIGRLSWYAVFGIVLFVLPVFFSLNPGQTTTFLVTVLYLMGPISTIIIFIPVLNRARIAVERINVLEKEIDAEVAFNVKHGDLTEINEQFSSIRFSNVTYHYATDKVESDGFALGPLNLEIPQGQIVFVTGGNGSGKSTFVNLLTGLYKPSGGEIYLNGHRISGNNYPYYSSQFSVIFCNNFLFRENYDNYKLKDVVNHLSGHIDKMQLRDVLKVDLDKNRIDTRLSKGQQKRLSMVYTLMEDRQIVVLDEWAAEQDPEFRAFFYYSLLPELKQKGKTVIAITHDDAYFNCADRIIKFDYGQIALDRVVEKELAPSEPL